MACFAGGSRRTSRASITWPRERPRAPPRRRRMGASSASPASVRAQVALGLAGFEHYAGVAARGFWLPECAFDPRFEGDLARAGVRVAVLDAHGIELADPRPPFGIAAPILSPSGVAFFG